MPSSGAADAAVDSSAEPSAMDEEKLELGTTGTAHAKVEPLVEVPPQRLPPGAPQQRAQPATAISARDKAPKESPLVTRAEDAESGPIEMGAAPADATIPAPRPEPHPNPMPAAFGRRRKGRRPEQLLGRPVRQRYRAQLAWEVIYTRLVVSADFFAGALAAALAYLLRFNRVLVDLGLGAASATRFYLLVSLIFPFAWVGSIALNRAYEDRFLGNGSEEFRRVVNSAARLIALVAIASYATKAEVARAYLLIVFPAATILTVTGRAMARVLLLRMRRAGRCRHRVLVVGSGEAAAALVRLAHRDPGVGWNVVGICLDRAPGRHSHNRLERADFELFDLPIVGTSERLEEAIRITDATTVAISPQMDGERLRRALWTLEGSNVDVLVSSTVTDVTGPRIHLRPVAGLPLLHIEEPELRGARRLMKAALDRGVATFALTLLAPALLTLALAVRLTSRGPAIFKQTRVGRDGRPFTMFKFRSMYTDAEARLASLADRNERAEGLLFKMRDDPRVTAVGKFLRKWSLDELPQLINVLIGTMSLVGPRPPLPREVAQYEGHVHRRLMVKPGLTGLWQVSGRSDLEWEEAVRLDLRYVENWSLAMDLSILWRTVFAVLKREGAY
ncbi:sugar transferase [Pseudofrankia sp. DC12]|uniref:sugar transferase n=1 Tax=Pseudofrankia sp. DC12 TaxID=683315 RepID=UPI001E2A513C|nr:sugar transferase [Pseudofrankia sp. DC12]